jgi:hypothetical protein
VREPSRSTAGFFLSATLAAYNVAVDVLGPKSSGIIASIGSRNDCADPYLKAFAVCDDLPRLVAAVAATSTIRLIPSRQITLLQA